MPTVDAIRKITIQASTQGVEPATSALNNLTAAQNRVADSADQLTASMEAAQKLIDDNVSKLNELRAANDNAAGGFSNAARGAGDLVGGLSDTLDHTLNLVEHFKLLALGAYALSPAFRAATNSGIATVLGQMPPILARSTTAMVGFAGPALTFFANIAAPITAAVVAWEGLNYTITLGSGLLDKYGNAQRSLFGSDVASNLEKLTKGQNFDSDKVSLSQQHARFELGKPACRGQATYFRFSERSA